MITANGTINNENLCPHSLVQIDPFDLDVFLPYLTSNAQRSVSRLGTLLGVLDGGQSNALNQVRAAVSRGR